MRTSFASLLRRQHVFTGVAPAERDEVFRVVLDLLVGTGTFDAEASTTILRAILKRERTGTTGIGHGIAIPHCKTTAVSAPVVALARMREPIPYGAADGDPVHSIFVVASPLDAADAHVAILKSVARIARDDYATRVLGNTCEQGSLFELIRELDSRP